FPGTSTPTARRMTTGPFARPSSSMHGTMGSPSSTSLSKRVIDCAPIYPSYSALLYGSTLVAKRVARKVPDPDESKLLPVACQKVDRDQSAAAPIQIQAKRGDLLEVALIATEYPDR